MSDSQPTLPPEPPEAVSFAPAATSDSSRSAWSRLVADLSARREAWQRYDAGAEIGRGGMGVVRRAFDKDLRRSIAMKVIRGESVRASPADPTRRDRTLGRFLEEAQVTGQLDHPGIVPVHDVGVDPDGQVYFTMKLVKGEDLRSVFRRVHSGDPDWNLPRALAVILRVCEAMTYAHAKGVIHRDLKPGNVMVGRFGETYVMDWGLARVVGPHQNVDEAATRVMTGDRAAEASGEGGHTLEGEVLGTPYYMAPEQAAGERDAIGPQADVYAVGSMLYQLLAARLPYQSDDGANEPPHVLARVLAGDLLPLRDLANDAPEPLLAIVEKAMARPLADRYASMQALADDLRAFLEDRVVRAHRTGALAELRTWIRRNRALALALATSALVVAGLFATIVVRERENADRQRELARSADAEKERVLRLSDLTRLSDLRAEMDGLWPARLDKAPAMRDWLARATALKRRLPVHEETLAALESQGREVAGDTTRLAFRDAETDWWYRTQASLVRDLQALCADLPEGATIAGMQQRLHLAETIAEQTVTAHESAWSTAIDSIGDERDCPAYAGLALAPQIGLVPLGRDPQSGLHEFADVQTGSVPSRGPDGALAFADDSAVVFVLIPGGTATIGAQNSDETAPNFDRLAQQDESDARGLPISLRLDPFFLAKHEMTQAQWKRTTGETPSFFAAGAVVGEKRLTPRNPVERVSWDDCDRVLRRLGFALPTEAQWEYATRAGTEAPWFTGRDPSVLDGVANLSDRYAREHGGSDWTVDDALDDGFTSHAPVGSFEANPFGLHDVLGNVWEWCQDGYGLYTPRPSDGGDGLRGDGLTTSRIVRSGCFSTTPIYARAAFRYRFTPTLREERVGVRPARAIER